MLGITIKPNTPDLNNNMSSHQTLYKKETTNMRELDQTHSKNYKQNSLRTKQNEI